MKTCVNDLAAVLEIDVHRVNVLQTQAACQKQEETLIIKNATMIEIDELKTLAACTQCPEALVKDAVATRTGNLHASETMVIF